MKLFRSWLPAVIAAVCLQTAAAYAQCNCSPYQYQSSDELDERDFDAIIDYLNSKRTIDLQEKACNLSISGDVRTSFAHIKDKLNGLRRRGDGATGCFAPKTAPPPNAIEGSPAAQKIGSSEFEVELNLVFDYKCDRSWAVGQVQFSNPMGVKESNKFRLGQLANNVSQPEFEGTACQRECNDAPFGSGRCDGLCLRKAYMGYNICADGCTRFDVEVGRRKMYDVFDSRIEFNTFFDGVLLRYATQLDYCSDLYASLGGFVIDSAANHYGWVIEVGALDIMDSGFDFKYSFIDWLKKGQNRAFTGHPLGWKFQVSQWLGYYHFDEELLCMPMKAYGALLWNSAARGIDLTHGKKANLAFYLGALIGEVCREGDWSLDINYQYVQAQAIPDPDVSGIGRDNPLGEVFYQWTNPEDAKGNANYKGWKIEGLYALTDNLSIDASFQYARACNSSIGGKLNYSRWKLLAIYAF